MRQPNPSHAPEPSPIGPVAGRRALLVGLRFPDASQVAALLGGAGYRVTQVALMEQAHRDLAQQAFDLVLLGVDSAAGTAAARDLLGGLRAFRCASRNAGCVVLAGDGLLSRAQDLAGCGANRVYPLTMPRQDLLAAIDQLLASSINLSQRFSCGFQMLVHANERWVPGTASDISAGGFLLCSSVRPELRRRFGFRIFVPGDAAPIEGEAMVVRPAASGGGSPYTGARICSFVGDGCARFAAVLARLRRQRAEDRPLGS